MVMMYRNTDLERSFLDGYWGTSLFYFIPKSLTIKKNQQDVNQLPSHYEHGCAMCIHTKSCSISNGMERLNL